MSCLEHINIKVKNLDKAITFFTTAMPDFKLRHRQSSGTYGAWAHVGTETSYVALNEVGDEVYQENPQAKIYGSHFGFVVDSIDALINRLEPLGYQFESRVDHAVRRRIYTRDENGHYYEFIEYLTDDLNLRNQYE